MKTKLIITSLICAILISVVIISHVQAQDLHTEDYEVWTVRQGDTLWKIASVNRGNTEIRKYIYSIEKLNKINSSIHPGQEIMLP